MDVITVSPVKPAWYDRNATLVKKYVHAGNVNALVNSLAFSYTVPAGKKSLLNIDSFSVAYPGVADADGWLIILDTDDPEALSTHVILKLRYMWIGGVLTAIPVCAITN